MMQSFFSFLTHARRVPSAFFFDIDGTLTHGRHALPGAQRLLQHMRREKIPFLLLTNDANHSREEKAALLAERGLDVDFEEIVSSGEPLRGFVRQRRLRGAKAFVLGALGNPCFAEQANLAVTHDYHQSAGARMVIIGEGLHDWQHDLTAAFNLLRHDPKALLCSPNPDGFWPDRDTLLGIGAGGKARFIQALLHENGCEKEIVYFGKPYAPIFDFALAKINRCFKRALKPEECMVIGDNLASDIAGANAYGMQSAIVLTGVSTLRHVRCAAPEQKPTFIFSCLAGEDE